VNRVPGGETKEREQQKRVNRVGLEEGTLAETGDDLCRKERGRKGR
jgi:hypothetical protein